MKPSPTTFSRAWPHQRAVAQMLAGKRLLDRALALAEPGKRGAKKEGENA
jgi:hypothetical protein